MDSRRDFLYSCAGAMVGARYAAPGISDILQTTVLQAPASVDLPAVAPAEVAQPAAQGTTINATEFALREKSVRHEFATRHPYPYASQIQKMVRSKEPIDPDSWFVQSLNLILAGQLGKIEASPKQIATNVWQRQSFRLLGQLPFGDSLSRVAGTIPISSGFDEEAEDKVARQNLQHCKVVIEKYLGPTEAEAFGTAAPLKQVQIFSRAFESFSQQLDFPCPWSVFLLDLDDEYWDDRSSPEPRALLGEMVRLNGGDLSPYSGLNKLSRQERTDKLRSAFIAAMDRGQIAAKEGTPEAAASLATPLWSRLEELPSGWLLHDAEQKTIGDKELVLRFFGKNKLNEFKTLHNDSSERRDMRVAATILCLMFEAIGGFLIE